MSEQLAFDFEDSDKSNVSAERLADTYSKIRKAREEAAREFDEKDQAA